MIELLPPSEWSKLESIFESEWGACLPDPDHAAIIVEREDDELIGFCVIETLVNPHNFFVSEKHRGNGTVRRLVEFVRERARSSGRSFITIADQPRYEKLFKALEMRPVGTAWRKDYFREAD